MRRREGEGTDLLPGMIAAASFLALVYLLRMNLWLSILLAACIYLGLWLATRVGGRGEEATVSAEALLQRLGRLYPSIPNPEVRSKIAQIHEQARGVLLFLAQHPEKADPWQGLVRDSLQSTVRIVHRYVELSRFLDDPSRQSVRQVEELLDQVAGTFANLRGRLVDEGAADLSEEAALFRSTLQALDEVNVLRRGGDGS